MSAVTAAKISISLPADLVRAVRRRVGARSMSQFAARAMKHELEREQLDTFLRELDESVGPVSKEALSRARRAWQKR